MCIIGKIVFVRQFTLYSAPTFVAEFVPFVQIALKN